MVTKAFQLLLLISPIAIAANINMDAFDLIFFRTGIIFLFAASLMDTPKRIMPGYINKIILGLLGLCLINIFIHTFNPVVLANTMNIFLAIIGFYTIYIYLDIKQDLKKFVLIAGAINLGFYLFQKIGFDPVFEYIPSKLPGAFLGNNPRLANYFTLLIPFLPFMLLPIGIILFFVTNQSVILIPIAIVLFMKLKTVKLRVGLSIIILLSAILFKAHILQSLRIRLDVWIPVLKAFFDRPLLGYGLGVRVIPDTDAFYSSYLSFITGIGILGLIWLGYMFKNIYQKIKNNKESVALITLAILALIEYPIEMIRLWYLIIFILVGFVIKTEIA